MGGLKRFFPNQLVVPCDLASIPSHGGVYALVADDDELIQLATAQNLRRTVGPRLGLGPVASEPVAGRPRADLASVTAALWWVESTSQFESTFLFHRIAYEQLPKTYRKLCSFGPSYWAAIDLTEPFPRWQAVSDPIGARSASIGPFAVRKHAEAFVSRVEALFDLCREYPTLQQAPHGQACAYAEMGRCAAPCDGTVPMSDYQRSLEASVDAVLSGGAGLIERFDVLMREAAAELAFERAARWKQDHEDARRVVEALRGSHRQLDEFRYLIVQRGRGRTLKPFFVHSGHIEIGEPVRRKELADVVGTWRTRVRELAIEPFEDRRLFVERLWLVCHFLHKRGRLPAALLHGPSLPDDDGQLALEIESAVWPKTKAS
jgi:excinuclease UvrABC nuclease subunit